jgi:hypothetical protein
VFKFVRKGENDEGFQTKEMIESDAAFTGKLIFGKTFLALIFSLS